uniref:Uncharacterized protein n=1 Tax=candidate division WOR-3 bacterium TaxID=2052148 RepID=A0A7C3UWH2_UNCW3
MFNLFLVIITSLNSLYDDYAKYAEEVKKVYEVFGESVGNTWREGIQKKTEAVFDKFPKFSLDSMKTESIVKSTLKDTTKTDTFMKNWKDSAKTYIKKTFWFIGFYFTPIGKKEEDFVF